MGSLCSASEEVFVVRGHHATHLFNIVAMGMSIEEVMENAQSSANGVSKSYVRDVFGTTPEDAAAALSAQRKFFTDFMNLPDDATVRFVAGQKDAICDSCVIGSHCEAISPKGDDTFLKVIGKLAREKGMEEVLTEGTSEIDGWKIPSPVVELPAWAIRLILGDINFHPLTLPKVLRPLARYEIRRAMKKG